MFRLKLSVAVAGALLLASPASARWRNTEWGMTREQVKAALATPMREEPAGLTSSITVGDVAFAAYFTFDGDGLNGVTLDVVDSRQCDQVSLMLERNFGLRSAWRDKLNDPFVSQLWEDTAQGNFVDFGGHRRTDGSFESCSVSYSPIKRQPVSGW